MGGCADEATGCLRSYSARCQCRDRFHISPRSSMVARTHQCPLRDANRCRRWVVQESAILDNPAASRFEFALHRLNGSTSLWMKQIVKGTLLGGCNCNRKSE